MPTLNQAQTAFRLGVTDHVTHLLDMEEYITQTPTSAEVKAWAYELIGRLPAPLPTPAVQALATVLGALHAAGGAGGFAGGFIDQPGPLPFTTCSREMVAMELVARVLDPKRIRQKTHPLCGVVVLMQDVCARHPDDYVNFVIALVTTRSATLRGMPVRIGASSRLLTAPLPLPTGPRMAHADYVALAGLRESEGYLPYRHPMTSQTLQGATMPGTLAQWMTDAGYTNVANRTLTRTRMFIPTRGQRDTHGRDSLRPHIEGMRNAIQGGDVAFMYTTGALTDVALGRARPTTFGAVAQDRVFTAFGGHWVRVLGVLPSHLGVRFDIVTWGRQVQYSHLVTWSKITRWYRGYVVGTP